jgi:hypothetical protein
VVGALLPGWGRLWAALLGLTAVGGLATAGYQSWLQYLPTASMECGFGEPTLIEQIVDWFGVLWPAVFMATGFCSSKDWMFLGLSMANWSGLCFLAFAIVAGSMLAKSGRRWRSCRVAGDPVTRRRGFVRAATRGRRFHDCPVLPKPPSPRALAAKSSTMLKDACNTGTITSCASRSSGCRVKGR